MERVQKIVGISFLTIIYCLSISMNIVHEKQYPKETQKTFHKKGSQLKYIVENQNSINFQISTENQVNPPLSNKVDQHFLSVLFHSEIFIFNQIKLYVLESNELLVRTRKNDYIFPFHYFW